MTYFGTEKIYVGADECGYGTLAGPLVVCAVAATEEQSRQIKCRDSKTYGRRAYDSRKSYKTTMLRDIASSPMLCYSIIEVDPDNLCRWGYSKSLGYAYRLAIATVRYSLRPRFPTAIIDGVNDHMVPLARTYPKADKNWPMVSLASCLAKNRQLLRMKELHDLFPQYGFMRHAGYGTDAHLQNIRQFGVIPHAHRIPIIAKMKGMHNIKTRIIT